MEAIILAGGLGTRLRKVVSHQPKPMAPVLGRPFLEHLIDYWIAQGIARIILSVGYKGNVIKKFFGRCYNGVEIDYAVEDIPRGTGGGLLLAVTRLKVSNTFLVLNGDTFCEVNFPEMRRRHHEKIADITMGVVPLLPGSRYQAIELGEDSTIVGLRTQPATTRESFVNAGVYLFEGLAFADNRDPFHENLSLEDQLLPSFRLMGKRMFGFVCRGKFIDIGKPEDYFSAAILLSEFELKNRLSSQQESKI